MSISYNTFGGAFLSKISEYNFIHCELDITEHIIDGYMKRALTSFRKNCKYDLFTTADDETRSFNVDITDEDLEEIVDIVSEGMVVQWLKPYVNHQELLQSVLNTRDFTTYSPGELLHRVRETYNETKNDYIQMIREYSYNHGALDKLHI